MLLILELLTLRLHTTSLDISNVVQEKACFSHLLLLFIFIHFLDVDWGFYLDTQKSITCFYSFLGNSLVSWKAKKHTTISKSPAKADYRVMATTTSKLIWLRQLLLDFGVESPYPALLFCDNQATIHIASNLTFHEFTKQIEIDCHFIWDKVTDRFLKLMPIHSQHQLTNIFTKSLLAASFFPLITKMAMKDLHRPS